MTIVHNVSDRRRDPAMIESWWTEPLDAGKLTEKDVGRTVIYSRPHADAEAGTLTSWREVDGIPTVFARYSTGDTSAGADADDLCFGVHVHEPDSTEPCTDEAREAGCTCSMESVNSASIDPPEPRRDRNCPLHGSPQARDPDYYLDMKRDEPERGYDPDDF